jgi:methyl-accepting chemotaxis protein
MCSLLANLTQRLHDTGGDEIGEMARALDTALERIGGVFMRISGTAAKLAGASGSLTSMAAQFGRSAEDTSRQAEVVAHMADEVSQNVQAVAACPLASVRLGAIRAAGLADLARRRSGGSEPAAH